MDTTKTKIKNRNYKNLMPNTNSSTIKVQKRDGRLEHLDINKIHFVVEEACEGLTGVSSSQIEMNANIQFCLLYTSPSPRDGLLSRMPSSA